MPSWPPPNETPPQGRAVYRRILDELRTVRFSPGARLREVEIAERLGHSRTPVAAPV